MIELDGQRRPAAQIELPFETEEWRPIGSFPHYEISTFGRARKVKKLNSRDNSPLYVPLVGNDRRGYQAYGLRRPDGKRTYVSAHILVLEAFTGPRPHNHVAHHRDANTRNNRWTNLEWATQSENIRLAYEGGNLDQRGSRNNGSKLTERDVIAIKRLLRTGRYKHCEIGAFFGVGRSTISQINTGLNWGHLEVSYATR